jgi:hypothetical protein
VSGKQDRFEGDDKKMADAKSKFEKGNKQGTLAKDGKGDGGKAGSGWEDKLKEEEKAKKMKELQEGKKGDVGVDKRELEKRKAALRYASLPHTHTHIRTYSSTCYDGQYMQRHEGPLLGQARAGSAGAHKGGARCGQDRSRAAKAGGGTRPCVCVCVCCW